ncbi:MAG TPA: GNAT family N-acetyltransferase, partial [Burkholderiaceae bacterium]
TQQIWLLDEDGAALGFYALEQQDGGAWLLDSLFVSPQRIGRGYGKQLFAHACELAREQGAQELLIDADPHAEAFYLSRGAQRTGEIAAPVEDDAARVRPQLRLSL